MMGPGVIEGSIYHTTYLGISRRVNDEDVRKAILSFMEGISKKKFDNLYEVIESEPYQSLVEKYEDANGISALCIRHLANFMAATYNDDTKYMIKSYNRYHLDVALAFFYADMNSYISGVEDGQVKDNLGYNLSFYLTQYEYILGPRTYKDGAFEGSPYIDRVKNNFPHYFDRLNERACEFTVEAFVRVSLFCEAIIEEGMTYDDPEIMSKFTSAQEEAITVFGNLYSGGANTDFDLLIRHS